MKKYFSVLLACIAMVCFISCSDDPNSLSASQAKKLFKKECSQKKQLEVGYNLQTGYYECNDDALRYQLRQLQANDIITYSCEKVQKIERVQKSRRVQRNNGWWSYWDTEYYWTNDTTITYFVTVGLTDKGKKLVMEDEEIDPTDDEKDLDVDEPDVTKYPEYDISYEEFPEVVRDVAEAVEEVVDTFAAEPPAYDYDEPAEETTLERSDYDKAKGKETIDEVRLLAYVLDIVKARNIYKTGDFTAKAEMVIEYDEVTPVGRIYFSVYEGQRFLASDINFKFLMDKGWIYVAD